MVKRLLSLILLSSVCYAGDIVIGQFSGLNTQDSPVTLAPAESQDLLNVSITPGGKSVYKRDGYGLYKTLEYSTSAIHGIYYFQDTSGSGIHLYGSDRGIYASVNGASTVRLATGTTAATWQCTDSAGFAYCLTSSRDCAVRTSGTSGTTSFQTGVPLGTMITSTPDRMIVSGVSGNESTLYVSEANTFTNFTTGVLETSPFTEVINSPGSRITHIRYACGKVLWWKDQSFGYTQFINQYDLENVIISPNIGSLDNSSDEYNGNVYFRGQDNHYYVYDCANVTRLSRAITPTIQSASRRITNAWTQTSQADFSAGGVSMNLNRLALSTTIVSGDILPSSTTIADTDSSDFGQGAFDGNIDSSTVSGSITLKNWFSTVFGSMNGLTERCGTVSTTGGFADIDDASTAFEQTSSSSPTGNFVLQAEFKSTDASPHGGGTLQFGILNSSLVGYALTIAASGTTYSLYLSSTNSAGVEPLWIDGSVSCASEGMFSYGLSQAILSSSTFTYDTNWHTVKLTRNNSTGAMILYLDGSIVAARTNNSFSSYSKVYFAGSQAPALGHWNLDNFYYQALTGNITSRAFDTQFSTPVWGTFTANTAGTGTFAYSVRVSSESSLAYGTDTVITSGSKIANSTRRYLIYSSTLTNTSVTSLPQLTDVTVIAASTGTYYSAVNNATGVTSWGNFDVTDVNSGASSITYYVRAATGPFQVGSSTPAWTLQSKNSTVNYSTGTYMQMKADFLITSATETPSISLFQFNWNEGTAADKAYIKYWNDYVWFSVSSGTTGLNNRIHRWDVLNQTWLLDNIAANGFLVDTDNLYFGNPSAGKIHKVTRGLPTDDGAAINSYWQSKTFLGNDPFVDNEYISTDFIVNQASGTFLTITYAAGTSTPTAYTMNLYDPIRSIVRKSNNLPAGKIGAFYSIKFGDNSAGTPWEVLGIRTRYNALPWRPQP